MYSANACEFCSVCRVPLLHRETAVLVHIEFYVTVQVDVQQDWLDIYRRYISLIYIRYFRSEISDIFVQKYQIFSIFSTYTIFMEFLKNSFNVTHCDYVLMSTVCVLCWLMTCVLSIS